MVISDFLFTMESGEIVEIGNLKELIHKKGIYANLYNTQKQLERYGKGGM